jgi:hypothetical protein
LQQGVTVTKSLSAQPLQFPAMFTRGRALKP